MLLPRRILIIDDTPEIQRSVAAILIELGHEPVCAGLGREGLYRSLQEDFALVIVDLGLPDLGGFEICRILRQKKPEIPILIITAEHDDIKKVIGFEIGADEFITKPFSGDVLRARVRSLLRRIDALDEYSQKLAQQHENENTKLRSGELVLDLVGRAATVGDEELVCTPIEFDLLVLLMQNLGRFLDRERLSNAIWGGVAQGYDSSVRTHIYRLRSKLEPFGQRIPKLESRRGSGYRLVTLDDSTKTVE